MLCKHAKVLVEVEPLDDVSAGTNTGGRFFQRMVRSLAFLALAWGAGQYTALVSVWIAQDT